MLLFIIGERCFLGTERLWKQEQKAGGLDAWIPAMTLLSVGSRGSYPSEEAG